MAKIYTRGGDGGETSLLSGGRVGKHDPRVEAYGSLDEAGSVIGLLRCEPLPIEVEQRLVSVQETLFAISSALADAEGRQQVNPTAWDPDRLEQWMDAMDAQLPPLSAFILAGGCRAAALAHQARTVCRRAERRVQTLVASGGRVPDGVLPYLNRLSDTFFVLARFLNAQLGIAEHTWHKTPQRP